MPEAILTGHVESVVCVDISASLALVISGAKREPVHYIYILSHLAFIYELVYSKSTCSVL